MKIQMKDFGISLAGREYGKSVAAKIFLGHTGEVILDFEGVFALGSSFGDEIFKKLKQLGSTEVRVLGCNKVVREALKEIQVELGISIREI